ncbi:hypothetical protein J6590_004763 [Homalodisca vitripennis]|nr:hypothetical protein J6590_004763 [Homalodisca vitripennis]
MRSEYCRWTGGLKPVPTVISARCGASLGQIIRTLNLHTSEITSGSWIAERELLSVISIPGGVEDWFAGRGHDEKYHPERLSGVCMLLNIEKTHNNH